MTIEVLYILGPDGEPMRSSDSYQGYLMERHNSKAQDEKEQG